MQKLDTRERGTRSGRRLSSSHVAIAEFFFFKEFEARFNFIVFEYLIYPHKVFVNIWDSYPFGRAVAAVALISGSYSGGCGCWVTELTIFSHPVG